MSDEISQKCAIKNVKLWFCATRQAKAIEIVAERVKHVMIELKSNIAIDEHNYCPNVVHCTNAIELADTSI